jgi:hypothetical protein
MLVEVLLNRDVMVEYAQLYVHGYGSIDNVAIDEPFEGQLNGLCGAAQSGALLLSTGLRFGPVHVIAERHSEPPAPGDGWEDVVEVSFAAPDSDIVLRQWDGDRFPLRLPAGDYRVRVSARGMDLGNDVETLDGDVPVDTYLLQFWPAPPTQDRVLRQTSNTARIKHQQNTGRGPSDEEAAEEQRAQDRRTFGDVVPNDRLRAAGSAGGLAKLDPALTVALSHAPDETHRAVAAWAAEKALTLAGIVDMPQLAPAVDALRRGDTVSSPFDNRYRTFDLFGDLMPTTTVARLPGTGMENESPIGQQWYAVCALGETAEPDSLEAAISTVVFTLQVYGPDEYRGFLTEIRSKFPALR